MPYPPQGAGGGAPLSDTTPTEIKSGQTGLAGTGSSASRGDHRHGFPIESITYPDVQKYNGNAPVVWTDLDLQQGQCIALLRVLYGGAAGPFLYNFRQNGETRDIKVDAYHLTCGAQEVALPLSYYLVLTDAAGLVEWYASGGVATTIRVIAVIKNCTFTNVELYNAVLPAAWTSISCGVGRCLAYLRVENLSGVSSLTFSARRKGDTDLATHVRPGGTSNRSFYTLGANRIVYMFLSTDAEGYIEMISDGAGLGVKVTLLAYLKNVIYPERTVFDGNTPIAWTDLNLGIGRALAMVKKENDTSPSPTDWIVMRVNGEASVPERGDKAHCIRNYGGYFFMPTDFAGIVEWNSQSAQARVFKLIAYTG